MRNAVCTEQMVIFKEYALTTSLLTTLIIAMIGCTGFWTFAGAVYQNWYNRKRGFIKDIADIKADIRNEREERIKDKIEEARNRILQFADECKRNVKHSREFFIQIRDDISLYEKYCKEHPDFPNGRTVDSIDIINTAYEHCKKENDFL